MILQSFNSVWNVWIHCVLRCNVAMIMLLLLLTVFSVWRHLAVTLMFAVLLLKWHQAVIPVSHIKNYLLYLVKDSRQLGASIVQYVDVFAQNLESAPVVVKITTDLIFQDSLLFLSSTLCIFTYRRLIQCRWCSKS